MLAWVFLDCGKAAIWARRPHKHRGNMQASHRNVQLTYAHELLTSNKWIVLDSVVYIKCLCLFSVTLRAVGALQFKIPVYNLYIWFLKIKLTLTLVPFFATHSTCYT